MFPFHLSKGAVGTIAAIEMDREKASSFGVIEVDEESRIMGFKEKPKKPKSMPGSPNQALVSMGVYLFNTQDVLSDVMSDAFRSTAHDFGKKILYLT